MVVDRPIVTYTGDRPARSVITGPLVVG